MAIDINADLSSQIQLPDIRGLDPSALSNLQSLTSGIPCADNASIAAFNEAIAQANEEINSALANIDGKINDAIGQLESKISEAEDALNDALGEFEAKVPNIQDDVIEALQLAVNPLSGGAEAIAEKLREIEEKYGEAVADVQGLIDQISGFIADPLSAIGKLCDELPNIELGPDGRPILRQPESLEPAATTEIEIGLPTRPEVTLQRESRDSARAAARSFGSRIASAPETITNGVGLDAGSINSLQATLLQRESSGDYRAINQYGFVGGYQFGAAALETLGYLEPGSSAAGNRAALQNPDNWTGKGGITSLDDFLSNPAAQDTAFQENLNFNAGVLRRLGTIGDDTPPNEVAGYLAASHLLGAGGASNSLDGLDGNGVTGREYFNLGAASIPETTVAQERPNTTPATTGSGSVTIADLTTGASAFPYPVPTRGSNVWGESAEQLVTNLELLASEVMSPIKDLYPDLIITHGFRSEYVEYRGGSYVPRRNVGSSDHYRGCACDFQFSGVSSREELIRRAEVIRNTVPGFRQFILEYPQSFDNNNFLLHISYRENDNSGQVLTSFLRNGRRVYEQEFV